MYLFLRRLLDLQRNFLFFYLLFFKLFLLKVLFIEILFPIDVFFRVRIILKVVLFKIFFVKVIRV